MQRLVTSIFAIGVVVLASGGTARATTVLYTPPLESAQGGESVSCRLVNVSAKAIDVTVDAMRGGTTEPFETKTCAALRAGDFCTALNGTGSALYCRFTIKGSKKNVRASIGVEDSDGHLHVALPAQ